MMHEYIENMFLLTNQICCTINVSNQLGFPHTNVINLLVNNQKTVKNQLNLYILIDPLIFLHDPDPVDNLLRLEC